MNCYDYSSISPISSLFPMILDTMSEKWTTRLMPISCSLIEFTIGKRIAVPVDRKKIGYLK